MSLKEAGGLRQIENKNLAAREHLFGPALDAG